MQQTQNQETLTVCSQCAKKIIIETHFLFAFLDILIISFRILRVTFCIDVLEMRALMAFEAVGCSEGAAAVLLYTGVRPLARVCAGMGLQVMRCRERLTTSILNASGNCRNNITKIK